MRKCANKKTPTLTFLTHETGINKQAGILMVLMNDLLKLDQRLMAEPINTRLIMTG
ncbi:hypothetical protein J6590_007486 [Homalodisca vitripennis]|nr:hypothetical protein J6590_007486 [Homalodisca vitripennis]